MSPYRMILVRQRLSGSLMMFLVVFSTSCSQEGVSGGGGGLGAPGCTCDDEWSIECYCSVFQCQTYEDAVDVRCNIDYVISEPAVHRGCGLVSVTSGFGGTQVYSGETHELVGASSVTDDSPYCGENSFSAGESLADCADVATEPLCP